MGGRFRKDEGKGAGVDDELRYAEGDMGSSCDGSIYEVGPPSPSADVK